MGFNTKDFKMTVTLNPIYTGLLYLFGVVLVAVDFFFGLGLSWWILCLPFAIPFIGVVLGLIICIVIALCVFLMTCCTLIWGALCDCWIKLKH